MKTNPPPHPPPRRHRTASCLVALAALLISGALIALSLFLPPIDLPGRLLAAQYSPLNAASPTIDFDGELRLSLPADQTSAEYAVKIERLPAAAFDSAAESDASLAGMRQALPAFLSLASPVYLLEDLGAPPAKLQIELAPPAEPPPARLSLYGWGGETWRFIPADYAEGALRGLAGFAPRALAAFQLIPAPPIILVSQEITQDLDPEIAALATILSPAGLRPTLAGSLIGSLAPGGAADAPYLFMPLIRNFADPRAIDVATIEALISRPRLQKAHIDHLSDLASYNRFDGFFIDYRGLQPQHREDFTRFISQLAASFSQRGLRLGVVIAPERDPSGGYDWQQIGAAADYIQLRPLINPLDYAPGDPGALDDLLRPLSELVASNKVLLGLGARSVRDAGGMQSRIGWHEAFAALGDVVLSADAVSQTGSIEPGAVIRASLSGYPARAGIEPSIQTAYLDYQDDSAQAIERVWLTDAAALRQRLQSAAAYGIAGVAFDDLLAAENRASLTQAIRGFVAGEVEAAPPTELQARWSIDGAAPLDEVLTRLDADLVLTLDAPDGNYAVNWAVLDETAVLSARRGAVAPVRRPTLTPTPTPIPTPTAVPRPAVIVAPPPEARPPAAPNFAAVPPPPGSISIELGGHVLNTGSGRTITAMRSAGMSWMKVQSRFFQHVPPDLTGEIANAHGNGFKILVGTVGNPADLANGGTAYVNAYTDWLQRIASQGADAIEVWNEPNLDREWPRGQISGVAYARMLESAYQKIKQVNGATMVISAAPAPTGAENAFPGQVMNDDRWLRELVSGGGLNYLDCVGVHYNEGIIPPNQSSGDPRDGYYTRFFYGMLNTYFGITGRPICFTELGYLTSAGYPALPPYFSWAQNVTVQQQAAWLAQAAALASQSGQVRLLIVWNIDFTHYGSDPQAGYAIIRPDGSCPACQALAGAR